MSPRMTAVMKWVLNTRGISNGCNLYELGHFRRMYFREALGEELR